MRIRTRNYMVLVNAMLQYSNVVWSLGLQRPCKLSFASGIVSNSGICGETAIINDTWRIAVFQTSNIQCVIIDSPE